MSSKPSPRSPFTDADFQREIADIISSLPRRIRNAVLQNKPHLAAYYRSQLAEFRPDIDPDTLGPRAPQ